jgi:HSP20 family molecular chaperone IbpA
MLDLNTSPFERAWLPSLDLHEEDGELVLHADLQGLDEEVEVSIDSGELVLHAGASRGEPTHSSRLPLPFPLQAHPAVSRPSAELLEVRIRIPDRAELQ